jgi:hypothetical protein
MIAVDTNPLVYAHCAGCPEHAASRHAIEAAASDSRGWGIPSPCLLETAGAEIIPLSPALALGVTEIWTHDGGFVALPGLKVLDPLRAA